jgi:hypothetical protein
MAANPNRSVTMSEFLFLYRGGSERESPAEMQQQMQRWRTWMSELRERGHLKEQGSPLDRSSGRVVTGKAKTVTDGPYPEKDIIGGYTLIEAKDLDQAAALAKGCPIFLYDGTVEVRAVMPMGG